MIRCCTGRMEPVAACKSRGERDLTIGCERRRDEEEGRERGKGGRSLTLWQASAS